MRYGPGKTGPFFVKIANFQLEAFDLKFMKKFLSTPFFFQTADRSGVHTSSSFTPNPYFSLNFKKVKKCRTIYDNIVLAHTSFNRRQTVTEHDNNFLGI